MASLMRMNFDRELADLREAILLLGSQARKAVAASIHAFAENDVDAAAEIIAADSALNDLRFNIEQQCYALLVREQPVAGDMRAIVAALTIAGELERIGDHGKRIARICQRTASEPRLIPMGGIQLMTDLALAMLDRVLQAVAARDTDTALTVAAEDDKVDALYKQTFNITLSYMLESTRAIAAGAQLIQVAHELERVADRATNIAERVIYAVKGELLDLNT